MQSQVLCVVFVVVLNKSNAFNHQLIKDYQKFKNLRTTLILTCETAPDIVALVKDLQYDGDGTWINLLDISNETDISQVDYNKFFVRLSYAHNVVCSLKCSLNQISKWKMFHYERSWLIFSESVEQTFNVLEKQNINSDAEITVVSPYNEK